MVLILLEYGKISTWEHFVFCTFSVHDFSEITKVVLVVFYKINKLTKPNPIT